MVINFNDSLTDHSISNAPVTTIFLEQYSYLSLNLKAAFKGRKSETCSYSTVSYHVTRMKEFVIKSGGLHAVELLAEYEKSSAIGDSSKCRSLELQILSELKTFRECWLSMLC